jgi:two-component system sensor histidine kinase KdpD
MSQSDKQIKSTYTPYLTSIVLVSTVVLVSFFFRDWIGYQVVALMLLVTVSMLAMFFEIRPVLVAAILSAVIWNFFFIPPTFTFHIGNAEDILLFLMYFIIAMVNAVMTFKIRGQAREVKKKPSGCTIPYSIRFPTN